MSDKITLGIDLGTTYSAAAFVDEKGQMEVIRNQSGKTTLPSVVLIQDGRVEVGDVALNEWITNENHVVRWIKRAMGDANYRFQGKSPVEISAEILKVLKHDAETHLGQAVEEAVITCPAYFAAFEIEQTKAAGELAGFKVKEIVKEPTAAAVFYGVESMKPGETVLVADLGGGTFDATVLTFANGVFTPRASMGSRRLGGHDWTMSLVALVAERFLDQFNEDPRDDLVGSQLLYEACERAKRDFATVESVQISCQCGQRVQQIAVTKQDFETRAEPYIAEMVSWCELALTKAEPKLTWKDINRILLVGGSSRLKRMKDSLAQASGQTPVQVRDPDLAVAYGAAILAKGKVKPRRPAGGLVEAPTGGLVLVETDRKLVRDLGTRAVKQEGSSARIISAKVIGRHTSLPTQGSRDFEVAADGQEFFELPVIEFEDADATDFELVGNYKFRCRPNSKRGDPIKVTFDYDISGIAKVKAFDVKGKAELPFDRLMNYTDPDPTKVVGRGKARWVVFTVDVSYSMEGEKLANAQKALVDTARQLLAGGGETRVGLVAFASEAFAVCQPSGNIAEVERGATSLLPCGMTAMDKGIRTAAEMLGRAPAGMEKALVLLTDGMPDARQSTVNAANDAKARGITMYNVGVGKHGVDEGFLKELSPHSLVVEAAGDIGAGFSTLLALSN